MDEVREINSLTSKILNNSFDAIVYYLPKKDSSGEIIDFTFTYMNDSSVKVLKGSREDFIGKTFLSLFPYAAVDGMFDAFKRAAETGEPIEGVYYYEEGNYKGWYRDSVIKFGDGIIVYFRDVTEQKEIELKLALKTAQLQESLEQISGIIGSINDPFLFLNKSFQVIYSNESVNSWFNVSDPVNKTIWELLPQITGTRIEKKIRYASENQEFSGFNLHLGEKIYEFFIYPISSGLTIYGRDVSEKLVAEQKLKKSLREKEILLKETHHRIKNNLQIIASMLNLQEKNIKDPVYREMINISRQRITTMAMIHQKLYEGSNYSSVNLPSFIRDLVVSLLNLYESREKNIELKFDIDEIETNLDYSVNLGIIFNELITNCLKYAFTGIKNGQLHIKLRREDSKFKIYISDNGIGLPEDFDPRRTDTLGLVLVYALVDQMDGKIEIIRSPGTTFTITLPI